LQRYEIDPRSARMRPASPPTPVAPLPHNATECVVRAVPLNDNAKANWDTGDTKDLRRARNETWSHKLISNTIDNRHEPLDQVAVQPGGLLERCPVDMEHQHFATLYPGVGATEFTAIMRRVFRGARHHFVPPRMHDVADCDRVDALWKMVLARWNAAIGQHLDPSDARVRLLGDRGDQTHALTEHSTRARERLPTGGGATSTHRRLCCASTRWRCKQIAATQRVCSTINVEYERKWYTYEQRRNVRSNVHLRNAGQHHQP